LITNGLLLEKLNDESLNTLTWCRISFDDSKSLKDFDHIAAILRKVCPKAPTIDWSLSYVVLEKQNTEIQHKIVALAKELKMLNVRFSPDQNNVEKIDLELTKKNNENECKDKCVYDRKLLGNILPECYLYLIKPFVAADGNIYPCCCFQYCSEKNDFSETDGICYYDEFSNKMNSMVTYKPKCCKCYFSHYNEYVDAVLKGVMHEEWV
jgi:hypothetical protein